MAGTAPLSRSRFKRNTAPKTMYNMEAAVTIPSIEAAIICRRGVCQIKKARKQTRIKATGIALVAGRRKITIKTKTDKIGKRARKDKIPTLIRPD
jgi:hypothetical protein